MNLESHFSYLFWSQHSDYDFTFFIIPDLDLQFFINLLGFSIIIVEFLLKIFHSFPWLQDSHLSNIKIVDLYFSYQLYVFHVILKFIILNSRSLYLNLVFKGFNIQFIYFKFHNPYLNLKFVNFKSQFNHLILIFYSFKFRFIIFYHHLNLKFANLKSGSIHFILRFFGFKFRFTKYNHQIGIDSSLSSISSNLAIPQVF